MSKSIDDILRRYLPSNELEEVNRILYGPADICTHLSSNPNAKFDLEMYRFDSRQAEKNVTSRFVRIAAVQHSIVIPTTEPIRCQQNAIFNNISQMIQAAADLNVNILCLPETWNMPFAFCTNEKMPCCEFAEDINTGPTTAFVKMLATQHNMVIISPILERDKNGILWNTAVVISECGKILGTQRKNHIPSNGESGYYTHGTTGHPVFQTKFGRIAVCICFDRHHPQSWLMYGLNGAEIVFNPCATTVNEHWWPIEARSAAVANRFYTVNLNRVGTEHFRLENGSERVLGPFLGSTYVAAPNGSRTKSLSTDRDGILYAELDLNICKSDEDEFGFKSMHRSEYYEPYFRHLATSTFEPQMVTENNLIRSD